MELAFSYQVMVLVTVIGYAISYGFQGYLIDVLTTGRIKTAFAMMVAIASPSIVYWAKAIQVNSFLSTFVCMTIGAVIWYGILFLKLRFCRKA